MARRTSTIMHGIGRSCVVLLLACGPPSDSADRDRPPPNDAASSPAASPLVAHPPADSSCAFDASPNHEAALDLVREYLRRDANGDFLRGDAWFDAALLCPGHVPGWDGATLIGSYEVSPLLEQDSVARFEVSYGILGRLTQDGEGSYLVDEPGTRLDTFVVLRTLYGWRIAAPVRHQHLQPHGALLIPNLKPQERARLEDLARQYQDQARLEDLARRDQDQARLAGRLRSVAVLVDCVSGAAIDPDVETRMTRRSLSLAFGFFALASLPAEVHAQVEPGVHVAHATDTFDGVTGVGGSLLLSLPAIPIDLFFAGEYFFPSCDDCSFWGGSADIHFSLPVPVITPYGTAGLVLRNTDASDTSVRTGGLGLGAGANLSTFVVGAYVEGRYELMDGSVDQLVFRLGVRF